jgi:hypothetical protein
MTYLRLSLICFSIAMGIGVLFVHVNCASINQDKRGACVINAEHIYKVQTGFGRKMRICSGRMRESDTQGHMWAEWWNEKRKVWCIWDWYGKSWYTAEESKYVTFRVLENPK